MKKIVKRICFLLALVSYLGLSSAKIATGKFQLSSEETEQYLAKFSFSPNAQGHISGWFHPETGHQYFDNMPHNLQVCLLEETAWDRFQEIIKKGSLCRERMHLCTWSTPVKISRGNRFKFNLNVEVEPRSHFWFAIVTDCYLEEYDAHPPILEYEIIFKNGGSHMPADEDGLTSVHLYLLIALGLFGAVYCYLMVLQYKHTGQLHLVVMFLLAAYAAQFGSVTSLFVFPSLPIVVSCIYLIETSFINSSFFLPKRVSWLSVRIHQMSGETGFDKLTFLLLN